ncbi:MAG: rhodanese-like domain-containing protein [Deltaproteobacteria bacterium]|nr:rhodanese-like domain-containing protein [Deltaproteobacteria bacterium]
MKRDSLAAGWTLLLATLLALGFNQLRSEGIPLVAKEPYPIFVPCPETMEEAAKVSLADLAGSSKAPSFPAGTLLIDARLPERFSDGHIEGAVNLPYDELSGVGEEEAARIRARPGVTSILVYCDGWEEETDPAKRYDHPPSEHLADELKSLGFENVSSMQGGLKAWLERGGTTVKGPEGTP